MKSIRTLFLTITVLITVVIFTFQAAFSYFSFSNIMYDTVESNLKTQAEKEASVLNSSLMSVGRSASNLADTVASMSQIDNNTLFNIIGSQIKKDKMIYGGGFWMEPYYVSPDMKYYGPYVYNDNGNRAVTWDYSNAEYDYFKYDWYKNGLNAGDGVIFSEPYLDTVQNITMITASAAISKNGKVIGTTTFDVSLKEMQDYIQSIKVGKTGYAFIITPQGYYWATKDEKKNLAQKITDDENQEIKAFGEELLKNDSAGVKSVDMGGEKNYMTYAPVGTTGLKLVTVIPESEAVAAVKKVFAVYFGVFLISIVLFVLAFSVLFNAKIIKPLKVLQASSQKLAKGDVSENAELHKYEKEDNEIGLLSRQFLDLSRTIKEKADAAEKIARGDLNVHIAPKSDSDVLTLSMQKVISEINKLVYEFKELAEDAIKGSLNSRADSGQFEGGFKELIDGANAIMDTLAGHIDTVPMPIMLIDNDYNLKYVNDAASKFVNKKKEELIGRKCYDEMCLSICNSDSCPARISFAQDIKAEQEVQAGISEILVTTVPYKDMEGNTIGVIDVIVDQTDIMNAQRIAEKRAAYQEKEVQKLIIALDKLARGRLDIETGVEDGDEDTREVRENFKKINDSLDSSIRSIKSYIEELSEVLGQLADKNFVTGIEREYLGDFVALKDSINNIIEQLSGVLLEINEGAFQVESGAGQVAATSQSLSHGASEQASAVEQIGATVTQVAEQIKQNAANANKANELSLKAKNDAQKGNEQMIEMLSAMNSIKESSRNIGNIIKVIDDIAFQTNILALNAAVEAARAGEHGKGFAVVAEEVRNLAARSAKAAQETTDMIDNSIHKIEEGYKIANETAEALSKIVSGVSDAVDIVGMIAEASAQQAVAIGQIDTGINQISEVTQNNTATAEETASASEEMAGQAQMLKGLIQQFRIKGAPQKMLKDPRPEKRIEERFASTESTDRNIEISLDDDSFGKY